MQLFRAYISCERREQVAINPIVYFATEHLEVLTLNQCCCCFAEDLDFFVSFTSLKCLNLSQCRNIDPIAMLTFFENNRGIESFTCDSEFFLYPELLRLLPNLEKLSLRYHSGYMPQNSLSMLSSLRHLTLLCWNENVNDILEDLAQINILEN